MNGQKQAALYRAPAADVLRVASVFMIAWYHIWQQSWLNPNFTLFGFEINMYPVVLKCTPCQGHFFETMDDESVTSKAAILLPT